MNSVRAGSLANFDLVAQSVGLDSSALLRSVGLDAACLDDPECRIAATALAAVLEEAASRSGRPDFGLLMAQASSLSDLGPVSLAIVHQEDLRGALQTFMRHRLRLSDAIVWECVELDAQVAVTVTLSLPPESKCLQLTEFVAGKMVNICRAVTHGDWTPLSATFRHAPAADCESYERVFGLTPQFSSAADGLILRRSDLDLTGPRAFDPAFRRHAEALVEFLPDGQPETISDKAARLIRSRLKGGAANLNTVAQTLGMNPRTLQRRLQADGLGFSELLDSVRRDLAQRYLLDSSLSVSRIAELLGYADSSAFTRWFSEQFQMPPSRWRETGGAPRHPRLAPGAATAPECCGAN